MNKIIALITAAALGLGLLLTLPSTAQAASCSTAWGSTATRLTNGSQSTLLALRAGRHECFDRLVLDLNRSGSGYRARYVSTVYTEGQGAPMALKGGAFLEIVTPSMATTRPTAPNVAGYTTFRQVGFGGSFEGQSTIGLGVRARLPLRVFTTTTHLVIDVAHRW